MALMIDIMGGKGPPKAGVKDDAEQTSVRRFFEAGQKGDWAAATAAFKRAYDICSGESEGPAEDSSEGGEYKE